MYKNSKNATNLSSPDISLSQSQLLQSNLLHNGWEKIKMPLEVRHKNSFREIVDDSFLVFHRTRKVKHNLVKLSDKNQGIVYGKPQDLNQKNLGTPLGFLNPSNLTDQLKASRIEADKTIDKIFRQSTYGIQNRHDGNNIFYSTVSDEKGSSRIAVLKDMRSDKPSFVIGFDTEFYYTVNGEVSDEITDSDCKCNRVKRHVLSWQFCFVTPDDQDTLHELMVFSKDEYKSLSLRRIIGYILEEFGIYRMCNDVDKEGITCRDIKTWSVPTISSKGECYIRSYASYNRALRACSSFPGFHSLLEEYGPDKPVEEMYNSRGRPVPGNSLYVSEFKKRIPIGYVVNKRLWDNKSISVTLVCHSGKADLSTFGNDDQIDVLSGVKNVQGGLCSINDIEVCVPVYTQRNADRFYPVSLCIRDTMCFTPGTSKSLASIGKAIGLDKIEIDETKYSKGNMLDFMLKDPVAYCDYAINDAAICLTYSGILWDFNRYMPITTANAAVSAAVNTIMKTMGCENKADFNMRFRGLKHEDLGLAARDNGSYMRKFRLVPFNEQCRSLQEFGRSSYNGGYNGSMNIGYFSKKTYDYDLINAYPTIMSIIPDVDWMNKDLIYFQKNNFDLSEIMVPSPFELKFAYGTFEFPEDVKYPCIPVKVGGCITYPRSSSAGVYMACPEMYLALMLGAKIHAEVFICARHIVRKSGEKTSLFNVVERFINDRNIANELYGSKSVIALLVKEAVNSIYGKCAQSVIEKRSWSASENRMVDIGESQITSPVIASMITSGVRSVLLAAINEITSKGYEVYSVTTDGFISDAPYDVVKSLKLYGLDFKLRCARFDLVQDGNVWQVKHEQDDLINLTTRGNTSLSLSGVNAHNSYRTGEESDSIEDRLAYEDAVMNRNGRIQSREIKFTSFRDLSSKNRRSDFIVTSRVRNISMDFDFKRKPVRESLKATYSKVVQIDGTYTRIPCEKDDPDAQEIACISTVPYENPEEFLFYRDVAVRVKCLRTVDDWNCFFKRLDEKKNNSSVVNKKVEINEHSILYSCLIAYRQKVPLKGLNDVPAVIPFFEQKKLNNTKRLEWINKFASYKDCITESDWDNAKRPARLKYMLPEEYFIGVLKKMMESC